MDTYGALELRRAHLAPAVKVKRLRHATIYVGHPPPRKKSMHYVVPEISTRSSVGGVVLRKTSSHDYF